MRFYTFLALFRQYPTTHHYALKQHDLVFNIRNRRKYYYRSNNSIYSTVFALLL